MITGIGVDLVEIDRIRGLLERYGDRIRGRLFTERELDECTGRADRNDCLAARFAAKEAAFKALGTGKAAGFRWHDVEVIRPAGGAPELSFHGLAGERARELGVSRAHVSLSHDGGLACAVVVLEHSPRTPT